MVCNPSLRIANLYGWIFGLQLVVQKDVVEGMSSGSWTVYNFGGEQWCWDGHHFCIECRSLGRMRKGLFRGTGDIPSAAF
jgi:hypothetical protein